MDPYFAVTKVDLVKGLFIFFFLVGAYALFQAGGEEMDGCGRGCLYTLVYTAVMIFLFLFLRAHVRIV